MVGSPKKKSAATKTGGGGPKATTKEKSAVKTKKAPAADGDAEGTSSTAATHQRRPSLVDPAPSSDFEAGLLFERFGSNAGKLDALSFQRMWREREKLAQLRKALGATPLAANGGALPPPQSRTFTSNEALAAPAGLGGGFVPTAAGASPRGQGGGGGGIPWSFEAGQLFERYDADKDGRLSRSEFEYLLNEYHRLRGTSTPATTANTTTTTRATEPPPIQSLTPAPLPPSESHKTATNTSSEALHNALYNRPPIPHLPNLTHYNETTGVPVPPEGVYRYTSVYGHTVIPIAEAYEKRLHRLQTLLTSQLLPRREQLLHLGRKIKGVEDEVRAARASIERETMADTNAILERLRSAESLKLATLNHSMNEVVAELESIDRLVAKVDADRVVSKTSRVHISPEHVGLGTTAISTSEALPLPPPRPSQPKDTSEMLQMIQSFNELSTSIERAVRKPLLPNEVIIGADDFRRETAERLEVLRRCDRYEQALSIKDQMLWSVLQDKQILHQTNKAEESLRKDYTVEIVEWINLTNRMADEITRLKEVVALVPNLEEANEKLRRENEALLEVLGRATSSSSSKREQLYE